LEYNLDAPSAKLSLLRSFFTDDWEPSTDLNDWDVGSLANDAAGALRQLGEFDHSLLLYGTSLRCALKINDQNNLAPRLHNASHALKGQNRLAKSDTCGCLSLAFAELDDDPGALFATRLLRFNQLALRGQWADASAMWQTLDAMGRDWPRHVHRPGSAEFHYAMFHFLQGSLTTDELDQVEHLAKSGRNRSAIRNLQALRGRWLLSRGDWAAAADAAAKAIRMAHEGGRADVPSETGLALARFHLHKLHDPRHEAIRLASLRSPDHLTLAELWHAIGDSDRAVQHAVAAHEWALADGHPYVHAYPLDRAASLLKMLGAKVPQTRDYDSRQDQKLPWEDEVAAYLEECKSLKVTKP
jgi:hypothetical protein